MLQLPGATARTILVRSAPLTVRCLAGSVWITHDADPGDHLLSPGGEFRATRPGALVVTTFTPSTIRVSSQHA